MESFLLKFGRCVLKAEEKLATYVCQSNLFEEFSSSKKYRFRSGFCDCHLYLVSWKFHLWREFSDYGITLVESLFKKLFMSEKVKKALELQIIPVLP